MCCQVTRCISIAAVKVTEVTEMIKKALDDNAESGHVGLVTSSVDKATSVKVSQADSVDMISAKESATAVINAADSDDDSSSQSSVVELCSVPAPAVLDSGIHPSCSFTYSPFYSLVRFSVSRENDS